MPDAPLPPAASPQAPEPPGSPVPPTRRRWRRAPTVLLVVVVLLVILAVVADHIQLGQYAISPGDAQPVLPLVQVPPGKAHQVSGAILLTDVDIAQVSLLQWIPDTLSSDTQLVPADEVLGPVTPADQLIAQGYLEMAQSQDAAKALAFQTLGYHVPEREAGAVLYSVATGTPAARADLQVGQILTAVNGTPVRTACALTAALRPLAPGQEVALSVEQSVPTSTGVLRPGRVVVEHVRLARRPASEPGTESGCPGVTGVSRGYLGVSVETQVDFTYPFPVHVDTTNIGGPSAGLAMTLGILAKLSGDDVTGGHRIAATGTIDASGAVGDVSGVPQKTVAVERAGATAFLVPPEELAAARSKATPDLHVYAVSTFRQAVAVLRRLGGQVPQITATASRH